MWPVQLRNWIIIVFNLNSNLNSLMYEQHGTGVFLDCIQNTVFDSVTIA